MLLIAVATLSAAATAAATTPTPVETAGWMKVVTHPLFMAVLVPLLTAAVKNLLNVSVNAKGAMRGIAGVLSVAVAVLAGVANGDLSSFDAGAAFQTLVDSVLLFLTATGVYKMVPKKE